MAYGKIKLDTITWDNSGTDTDITVSTIPTAAQLATKAPLASPTFTGTAVFNDLTVNGTNTVINTTTLQVEDKNIELGKVSTPTDTTADGGGITLKGASDKTITWTDSTDSWDFNQDILVKHAGNAHVIVTRDSGASGYIQAQASKLVFGTTTNHELSLMTNSSGRVTIAAGGNATFTGSISDSNGDVRKIPYATKTSAYTLVEADGGKVIYTSSGGVTVPANVIIDGYAINIINNSGSDQTITQGSGMTIYNTADASTGNRTLAGRGMATLYFVSSSACYISGAGLS